MHARTRLAAATYAAFLALLTIRCTSSSTAVTAPDSSKCAISVSSNPSSFTANGGAGSLAISTARDCTWTAAADAAWVSVAAQSGQGNATVQYTVASNPSSAARTGTITVGPERVQVSQAGAPCLPRLSQSSASMGATGGALSVGLSTLAGCAWTATADVPWIDIAAPSRSGTASATVQMQVAANPGAARVGRVNISGQILEVQQAAATTSTPPPAPDPAPAPSPSPSPTPSPTPGGVAITLEGVALSVAATCPDISFLLAGRMVFANKDTDYKHGHCTDLTTGDTVKVNGTTRTDGGVDAKVIEIKNND